MSHELLLWIGFNAFVLAMLALDLGVFHRKAHEVKIKEALWWSAVGIALGFLTGYLLEKSTPVSHEEVLG